MIWLDWPIGTEAERAAAPDRLPGHWEDDNPFLTPYQISGSTRWSYHTGADLNLNTPAWNADWHTAICAMAPGVVIFQGPGGGSWGHILVIWHYDRLTGQGFYCRFGHIERPQVITGQVVARGQVVAYVGNGDGYYGSTGAHLHWDIGISPLLERQPNEWPGLDKALLQALYTAPIPFVVKRKTTMLPNPDTTAAYRALLDKLPDDAPITVLPGVPDPKEPTSEVTAFVLTAADLRTAPTPPVPTITVLITEAVNVRSQPLVTEATKVGSFPAGAQVEVEQTIITANLLTWYRVASGQYKGDYFASQYARPKA